MPDSCYILVPSVNRADARSRMSAVVADRRTSQRNAEVMRFISKESAAMEVAGRIIKTATNDEPVTVNAGAIYEVDRYLVESQERELREIVEGMGGTWLTREEAIELISSEERV